MELNVGKEIAALKRMTVGELRARYAEVFGEETHARNKQWLVKRVIWRLQSMSEGTLSERARTRAAALANDADLRRRPPKQTSATTRPVSHEASRDRRLPIIERWRVECKTIRSHSSLGYRPPGPEAILPRKESSRRSLPNEILLKENDMLNLT